MNRFTSRRREFIWRAFWPFLLMGTILWCSGGEGMSALGWWRIPHFDKLAHVFVFGLLATVVLRALPGWVNRRNAMLFAIGLTAVFGFADEVRQSFNPHRTMDFVDWLCDTTGAVVAVLAYTRWPFYRKVLEWRVNLFTLRHGGRPRSQTHSGTSPEYRPAR